MRLNRKQSGVVYVALVALLAMLLFPPFRLPWDGKVMFEGYRFVLRGENYHEIDASRLFVPCAAVLVVAVGAAFALRDRN